MEKTAGILPNIGSFKTHLSLVFTGRLTMISALLQTAVCELTGRVAVNIQREKETTPGRGTRCKTVADAAGSNRK
jgi:hypothetical protein